MKGGPVPSSKTSRKQADGKGGNLNPTGKGGFGDHKDHINRRGRPKSGTAIKDMMREMMSEVAKLRIDGKEVKKEWLRAFCESLLQRSLTETAAARLVWQQLEGLPPFTGRVGTLPDEEVEIDPEEEDAIEEHLSSLIMGRGNGASGNGDGRNCDGAE